MIFFKSFYFFRNLNWFFLRKKLQGISLLILDVDGVLTNGQLFINSDGQTLRNFNVKDGLGIKLLIAEGIEVAFMSGGSGNEIQKRAENL